MGDDVAGIVAGNPPTIVRTYRGKQQADAVRAFQLEASSLAANGYVPTSQSWAQGQWGCGAFLIAILLFIVLIGLLIFLYMLIVKPDGTLTVVYSRQERAPRTPVAQESAIEDLAERLGRLTDARAAGLITEEEYASKRAEILDRL